MAVTNPYYEFTPSFVPGTTAKSSDVNIQYNALQNAFDLLPGASDALTTDTAVFAPESGAGNAYVVTMPDTRLSNKDGDGIRFFATHTNTGATTLNVDGLGAIALVNWDGTALTGSEIVSGRIYEVRYDATGVQFVLAATTDAALQVTYAEEWATKPEDVLISISAGGDGVSDFSSLHWAAKSLASATSGRVNTDIVTATPPTTEAVTGGYDIFDAITQDDDRLARFGFNGSNNLRIKNHMHGGELFIFGEDVGGTERFLLNANPDGAISLYYAGASRFLTQSVGAVRVLGDIVTATPPVAEAISANVQFYDSDNTDAIGKVGFFANNSLQLQNFMHGGAIVLSGQDDAGSTQSILVGDPDNTTSLYAAGVNRLTMRPAGVIGLRSDGNTDTETRQLVFEHQDGTDRGFVGYGVSAILILRNLIHGAAVNISAERLSDGAVRNLIVGDPDTTVDLYNPQDNVIRATVRAAGIFSIRSNTDTDTEVRRINFEHQAGTLRAFVGYEAGSIFQIQNRIHGGGVRMSGERASDGANRLMFVSNPDTTVDLYNPADNVIRMQMQSGGVVRLLGDINTATPPTTENVNGRYLIRDSDNTDTLAELGFTANNQLRLTNRMHGGRVDLRGEDDAGVDRQIMGGDPDSGSAMFHAGNQRLAAQSSFAELRGSIAAATPPTTELVDGNYRVYDTDGSDLLGLFGHNGSDVLVIENRMHGGAIEIVGENAGSGARRVLISADPDGPVTLRNPAGNVNRLSVRDSGILAILSNTSTDTEVRQIVFEHQDGTIRALVGHEASDIFVMRNQIHGGDVLITAEDGAGTPRTILIGDPDALTTLRADTNLHLEVAAGEDALIATANAGVALFHNDIQKFITTIDGVDVEGLKVGSDTDVMSLKRILFQTDVRDLGTLGSGASEVWNVTVTGAITTDTVQVSADIATSGILLRANVSAADTVRIFAQNVSGGNVNWGSTTFRIVVFGE